MRLILRKEVPHVVGGHLGVARHEAYEAAEFVERGCGGGKSAFAFAQVFALAVNHLHGNAAALRVVGEVGGAEAQGVALHEGVGVEQQHEVAVATPYGLVVGFGKSEVVVVGNHLHLRVFGAQHLYRAVVGVVVGHYHLNLFKPLVERGGKNRGKALVEVVPHVVVDNYHANDHGK